VKLLALMRPGGDADVRAAVAVRAHAELQALWELYRGGVVREMYSPGGPGAVLVLEASSAREAARALSVLPLLADRIMVLEVMELHPFAGLELLFSDAPGR
jgi:hypothetical protein